MVNFIKNNILGFILGAVIFGGGTLAYSYNAKQVSFTPNDKEWKVTNVSDAVDSLKEQIDLKNIDFDKALYSNYVGTKVTPHTQTLELEKGKYFVIVSYGNGWGTTEYKESSYTDYGLDLKCINSNCNIKRISNQGYYPISEGKIYDYYLKNSTIISSFYVDVNNKDTISYTYESNSSSDYIALYVTIQAIKIRNS